MKNLMNLHCAVLIILQQAACQQGSSLVNFQHLEHLTEEIVFLGDTVNIVHVYSNYPDYHWVDAKESGIEGIACVDDAARAAVLYLRNYQLTQDEQSLDRAKALLRFVLNMQAEDGLFYNFILSDYSINRHGRTSYKSFGWWAARATWCMALGYRIFEPLNKRFASRLRNGIDGAIPHVEALMENYGQTDTIQGYAVPRWLLYGSAADATSELLLGLIEYYAATGNQGVRRLVEKLSDGLVVMQDGDMRTYPYALHRSWQTSWHMWGNGQTQALAHAGRILNNRAMIKSAEREAKSFYSRLLIQGFRKEMDVAVSDKEVRFDQIAYGFRPMVAGLIRLYEATSDTDYLKMAGLAGSWFFGNNILNQQMYDPKTGRCFDGIKDSSTVNKNSGAESTIEALYTVLELEQHPIARRFLEFTRIEDVETRDYMYAVFQNALDEEVTLALDIGSSKLSILEGTKSKEFQENLKRH